jgi:hypothetical protein
LFPHALQWGRTQRAVKPSTEMDVNNGSLWYGKRQVSLKYDTGVYAYLSHTLKQNCCAHVARSQISSNVALNYRCMGGVSRRRWGGDTQQYDDVHLPCSEKPGRDGSPNCNQEEVPQQWLLQFWPGSYLERWGSTTINHLTH